MAKRSNQQSILNYPKSSPPLPYFLLIVWAIFLMLIVFLHFVIPNKSLLSFSPQAAFIRFSPTLINLFNGPLRKTVTVETSNYNAFKNQVEAQDQLLRAEISLKQQITPTALLLKANALVTLGNYQQVESFLNQAQALDPNTQSTQDFIVHIRKRLAESNNHD